MRCATLLFLLALGCNGDATTTAPADPALQPQNLPTIDLPIAGRAFKLMVADDRAERQKGLMFRREMAAGEGMLFVFAEARPRGFFMKNCYLPLDFVYVGADERVVSIRQGTPGDARGVPSGGPVQYVVELNAGVAERIGLKPGDRVEVPDELVAKAEPDVEEF